MHAEGNPIPASQTARERPRGGAPVDARTAEERQSAARAPRGKPSRLPARRDRRNRFYQSGALPRRCARQLRSFSDLISGLVHSGRQPDLRVASAIPASLPDRLCPARSRYRRDRRDRHPSGLDLHRLGGGSGDGVPVRAAQPAAAPSSHCRMGAALRAACVTAGLAAAAVYSTPASARRPSRPPRPLGRMIWSA